MSKLLFLFSYLMPDKISIKVARFFLALTGIGWGTSVAKSGEKFFLKRLIKNLDSPIIFDVGANVGDYALSVIKYNSSSKLHLFEPSNSHLKILELKLKSSNDITINNYGLSTKNENLELFKDKEITGLATVLNRDLKYLDINFSKSEKIKLMIGDEYITKNRITNIDLLKIDTEGYELNVLKGFKKALSKKLIKNIQFEFSNASLELKETFRDYYRFLKEFGYNLSVIKPNGHLMVINDYNEIFENYYTTNFVACYLNE